METTTLFIEKKEKPNLIRWRRWLFVQFLSTLIVCIAFQVSCQQNRVTELQNHDQSINLRETPISFDSKRKPLIQLDSPQKDEIWEFVRLPKDDQLGLSYVVHLLKVYSERPEKYENEIRYLKSVIQNEKMAKKVLGDALFRPSKFGIAMVSGRMTRAQESHRDQGVAELGLLGLPTAFEIEANGKKYPFRDAIKECIANFYLQEKELAWSAVVLDHFNILFTVYPSCRK